MGSGEVLRAEGLGRGLPTACRLRSPSASGGQRTPLNIPQGLAHLLGASPASLSGR